jgi:hypothetical protein
VNSSAENPSGLDHFNEENREPMMLSRFFIFLNSLSLQKGI